MGVGCGRSQRVSLLGMRFIEPSTGRIMSRQWRLDMMDAIVFGVTGNSNCSASEEFPPQLIMSAKSGYDIFHATE